MLSLMVHAHPRIAIPPENRFVVPSYLGRESFGDLSRPANRRKLAEEIIASQNFPDLGLDPDLVRDRVVAQGWTVGAAVGSVLRAYSDRFGKVRWGDKRPNYRNHFWMVRAMFPDAQFVHVLRDGRDCVASMKTVPPWDEAGFYPRVRAWTEAADLGAWARESLPADTFFELQYENLVSDPEKHLTGLCEFLGEAFDDAMLNPQDVAVDVVPEAKTWHEQTRKPVSTSSIGNFRRRLEPWQLEVCEAVLGDRLRRHGYELTGAAAPPDECLEEYARADAHQTRFLRRRRDRDRKRTYDWPVADMSKGEAQQRRRVADLEGRVATLEKQNLSLKGQRDRARGDLDRVRHSRTCRLR